MFNYKISINCELFVKVNYNWRNLLRQQFQSPSGSTYKYISKLSRHTRICSLQDKIMLQKKSRLELIEKWRKKLPCYRTVHYTSSRWSEWRAHSEGGPCYPPPTTCEHVHSQGLTPPPPESYNKGKTPTQSKKSLHTPLGLAVMRFQIICFS